MREVPHPGSCKPRREEGAACAFASRTDTTIMLPSHNGTWHFENSFQIRTRSQLFGFFLPEARSVGKKKNCHLKHLTLKAECFKIICLGGGRLFSLNFFFFPIPPFNSWIFLRLDWFPHQEFFFSSNFQTGSIYLHQLLKALGSNGPKKNI